MAEQGSSIINLTEEQAKMLKKLNERSYVLNQQLQCAHAKENIKLVGDFSRKLFRINDKYSEYVHSIIRQRCDFEKKPICCHHRVDISSRRILMSWDCLEHSHED